MPAMSVVGIVTGQDGEKRKSILRVLEEMDESRP